jgi:hypothetical protein
MTTATRSDAVVLLEGDLPTTLRAVREELNTALRKPVLGAWPDECDFHDAPQPKAIGEILVDELHTHLANRRIGFLFREEIKSGGQVKGALASKVSGKLHYYTELEFMVEVNWTIWRELRPAQRIALIDHELCHFGTEDGENGLKLLLLPHDVEEFSAIVQRWGLWDRGLIAFNRAINHQMSLFLDQPAALEDKHEAVAKPGEGLKLVADEEARRAEADGPARDGGTPAKPRKKGKK